MEIKALKTSKNHDKGFRHTGRLGKAAKPSERKTSCSFAQTPIDKEICIGICYLALTKSNFRKVEGQIMPVR